MNAMKNSIMEWPIPQQTQYLPLVIYLGFNYYLGRKLTPKSKPDIHLGNTMLIQATLAFAFTWYQMLKFIFQSAQEHRRSFNLSHPGTKSWSPAQWLEDTSLFKQAWLMVCENPVNWQYSIQVCLLTVGVWTTFLWSQKQRQKGYPAAQLMLLGQLVAVSVAASLGFAHFAFALPESKPRKTLYVPLNVTIPIILGFISIAYVPFSIATDRFLPNLLFFHLMCFVPLLTPNFPYLKVKITHWYIFIFLCSLAIRLLDLPRWYFSSSSIWSLFIPIRFVNMSRSAAQSSISFDLLWTILAFLTYFHGSWAPKAMPLHSHLMPRDIPSNARPILIFRLAVFCAGIPFLGPANAIPAYSAWYEKKREDAIIANERQRVSTPRRFDTGQQMKPEILRGIGAFPVGNTFVEYSQPGDFYVSPG